MQVLQVLPVMQVLQVLQVMPVVQDFYYSLVMLVTGFARIGLIERELIVTSAAVSVTRRQIYYSAAGNSISSPKTYLPNH